MFLGIFFMFSTNVVLFPINVISSFVSVKLLYEQEVFHFFFLL